MRVTRRQFLKVTGATAAVMTVAELGFNFEATASAIKELRIKNVTPTPTICPFCASGCGLVVYAERDDKGKFVKLLSVHGDPDNPINMGGACSKGAAMFNLREVYDPETGEQMINPKRVQKPLYRAPGATKWEEKDWDWMLDRVAEKIKETRDKEFIHTQKLDDGSEVIVNRTEKIACLGGSCLDNEEAYLLSKFVRSLGIVYVETQARI